MTDEELIAYLRLQGLDKDIAAADRIEALIAERDEYHSEAMTYIEKWGAARKAQDEAEAKLAKAVEALGRIARQPDYRLPSPQGIAQEALAEIKGESQ